MGVNVKNFNYTLSVINTTSQQTTKFGKIFSMTDNTSYPLTLTTI